MHAYKQRPDDSYIPARRQKAVVVAADGEQQSFAAHPSPAKAMHDDLVARLSTSQVEAGAVGLSIRSKFAVIAALALTAWLPVAAIGYLTFG
jgi:hypothetical protein